MEGQVYAYQGATEVFLCVGLLQEVEIDRQNQSVGAKGKTYDRQNISKFLQELKLVGIAWNGKLAVLIDKTLKLLCI